MLLCVAIVFLLAPFPSFQATTNEKRDFTRSELPKRNAILSLSRPNTAPTVSKHGHQDVRHTSKLNVVNETILAALATNQKPLMANVPKTTQNKQSSTVIHNTSTKSAQSSGQKTKPTKPANQTVIKLPKVHTSKTTKEKSTISANQMVAIKLSKAKQLPSPSQPITVVVTEDCSNHTKELKLNPGSPLVMTHKISLVPGGCTGGCVAQMAALKERVAKLEGEMSSLKENCPCSKLSCPNDCNGNGKCERGQCVCFQGFTGTYCSKCASGSNCDKKGNKENVIVEMMTLRESGTIKEKKTKTEQTVFQKKTSDNKETQIDSKTKGTTKASLSKNTLKQRQVGSSKTGRPTVGQILLKHQGGKTHEEARKGKTIILTPNKQINTDPKSTVAIKVQPQANVTQSHQKKLNGTALVLTIQTKVTSASYNKTRQAKEKIEQSTLAEKNVTQIAGKKQPKKVKVQENMNATKLVLSVDNIKSEAVKEEKGQIPTKSQYKVNVTTVETSQSYRETVRKAEGSGLGSVKVENITSYSFILTWSSPQGMFKNFTVYRREHRADGEDEDEEEARKKVLEERMDGNTTDLQIHKESLNGTATLSKVMTSKGKTEQSKRVSMVLPGSVRSVEFSNLRPQTHFALQIFGTAPGKRSKIHRVKVMTGPEPATELVFSNVTEASLTASWSRPKGSFTGYKVTYTNLVTGERRLMKVDAQDSLVVLSKLSAGSTYVISVISTQGKIESDALTSRITTVPAPPTHILVTNITDTRAVLQWTPSLGKVDRFIISYESAKTPNVTVTVMVSGGSVEHQLRGLQRATLYTVKALSQKDSLQSTSISATFSTANVVKASDVGARSAVITWKEPTVTFHSYRLTYQVVGEEFKELTLDPTVTSYKLMGLLPMSRYFVLVQGEKDGAYTSVVTTEFITGKLRFPFPTECSQELLNGALHSGEVDIYPQGKEGGAVRVYCDMETDGGGWTVFQRRMNGKTDFYRTWSEYTIGFGNLSEEFWLGSELLHNLTSLGHVSLRVDLHVGDDTAYAHYSNFSIDNEDRHYTIEVSGYTGTAGDSMRYHNGRPFSTRDKDPNPLGIHCARAYMGGWWYKNCYKTNLNGLYGTNSNNQGVIWIDWKGKDSSIPFTEMKIRPSGFSPATHG